ncbi:hypothetical protein GGR38_004539 [Novosphingobium sediminicola]|uniref:Uncharacterized protein n=1 Tax=Novosphingobium sediminicola TaxID=563162 RepID=A0A7W6G8T9_9SPHN|nr:hypothetical protein [Novosphingobium sediminicola]
MQAYVRTVTDKLVVANVYEFQPPRIFGLRGGLGISSVT